MAKRLPVIFFIVIGIIIFLIAGFCLTLFLAPGLSVFGLKYIRSNVHEVATGMYPVSNTQAFVGSEPFQGNLIVETDEVPINIIYSQGREYIFQYYDNFDGFTTSKIEDPTITISKTANGEAYIKTTEYKKFVYESSSSERYLNIYIPLVFAGGDGAYSRNLTIISKSAPITFTREDQTEDIRVPSHNKLTIQTESSKIIYYTNVRATTLNYTTNNSIRLFGDANKELFATHYELESKRGNITIKGDVVGNVNATTKNGYIALKNCKNLIAKTTFGDIMPANKNEEISIVGIVDITTKAGAVKLGDVNGNGENKITTSGGSISINKIKELTATTKRGSVTIKSVDTATITTNIGKITVEEALTKIVATTKRGNIVIGGEGLTVSNPYIRSELGTVTLKTATGIVDIKTGKGKVDFKNKDSQDITIISGGNLIASNITGKVNITAHKSVDVAFTKITDETIVNLEDTCKFAKFTANLNTKKDTKYFLKGLDCVLFEDEGKAQFGNVVEPDQQVDSPANIVVEGKNAVIHLYFKLAA